jgi:membrane fusion protein (multidrug efflux system)
VARSFARSLATLDRDARRSRAMAIGIASLLLIAWVVWLVASRVSVYAVSEQARLEVDRAVYPVEAPVAGRVVSTNLRVGQTVEAGETLAELDTETQALQVGEQRARLAGINPQLERVNAEIAQEENALQADRQTTAAAKAEAQARYDEAKAAVDFALDTERRTAGLFEKRLVSEAEMRRVQADTRQRQAAAETLRLSLLRLDAEQLRKDSDHQIQIERLRRDAAELKAQSGAGSATLERLEHEGQRRRLVAPIAGTIAEISTVRAGGVLQEGDKIATIVPSGALRIVAQFLPASALGRVREGQHARLRLDGFPWTQYGSVTATVASVASEVRDGLVRVELDVDPDTPAAMPLQHGLPGSVEVEVERLSPAALVLRAAGQRLTGHTPQTSRAADAR